MKVLSGPSVGLCFVCPGIAVQVVWLVLIDSRRYRLCSACREEAAE